MTDTADIGLQVLRAHNHEQNQQDTVPQLENLSRHLVFSFLQQLN
jgi:hypothetical protein